MANRTATDSLINVERDNLGSALDSVQRALLDIQNSIASTTRDNANWDELHDQVVADAPDPEWIKGNLDPSSSTATINTFNLDTYSLWNHNNKLIFSVGHTEEFSQKLGSDLTKALDDTEPHTLFIALPDGIFIVSYA